MQDNEKLEEICMTIIANSGAGRSSAFEALNLAKQGRYAEADGMLATAHTQFHDAHEAHRSLLQMDAQGELGCPSVLVTHAQDHLMTSVRAEELIREIMLLYRKIDNQDKQ